MEHSFWIGTHLKDFLFKGYTISSIWGLAATCLGVASLAILYEGGRVYRMRLKSQTNTTSVVEMDIDSSFSTNPPLTSYSGSQNIRLNSGSRIAMAAMYAILCIGHDVMGYILMLCVMTMNVGLAIAIWLGAGIGYFIFAANINVAVSPQIHTHCMSNGEGGRDSESRSCEDSTAVSELQREEIIDEERALWAGNSREESLDDRSQKELLGDIPAGGDQLQCNVITSQALIQDIPAGGDQLQCNVITSQALIHNEPRHATS